MNRLHMGGHYRNWKWKLSWWLNSIMSSWPLISMQSALGLENLFLQQLHVQIQGHVVTHHLNPSVIRWQRQLLHCWIPTPFSYRWPHESFWLYSIPYLQILLSVKHNAFCFDFSILNVYFVPAKNNGDVFTHSNQITMPIWHILVCNSRSNIKHYNGTLPLKQNA